MNDELLKLISKTEAATHLKMKSGNFVVNDTIGVSLLFSSFYKEKPGKFLILTSNLYVAQKVSDFIASLLGENNVFLYPFDDMLRTETLTSSKELLAQRLYVLSKALENSPKIIVTHVSALTTSLSTVKEFIMNSFKFEVGKAYNLSEVKEKLVKAGYEKVNKIDQTLQFASRGDILDIFPVSHDKPIRIEFFGDEVESIHYFDVSKQLSTEALQDVIFEPANDVLFTDDEIRNFKAKTQKEIAAEPNDERKKMLQQSMSLDIERIESRFYHSQFYKYTNSIKEITNTLVDYFNPDLIFVSNKDQIYTSVDKETNKITLYIMNKNRTKVRTIDEFINNVNGTDIFDLDPSAVYSKKREIEIKFSKLLEKVNTDTTLTNKKLRKSIIEDINRQKEDALYDFLMPYREILKSPELDVVSVTQSSLDNEANAYETESHVLFTKLNNDELKGKAVVDENLNILVEMNKYNDSFTEFYYHFYYALKEDVTSIDELKKIEEKFQKYQDEQLEDQKKQEELKIKTDEKLDF